MKIEVNVTDLDLSAAIDSYARYDHDTDEHIDEPVTLADKLVQQLVARAVRDDATGYPSLRKRVEQIRDEEIRALVAPAVAEAFAAPVRRTNDWGEPISDPVPLRDQIIAEARKTLDGVTRSSSYDRTEPLARRLIRELVAAELQKELGDVIKAERDKVIVAVRDNAAELIAEAVKSGMRQR